MDDKAKDFDDKAKDFADTITEILKISTTREFATSEYVNILVLALSEICIQQPDKDKAFQITIKALERAREIFGRKYEAE